MSMQFLSMQLSLEKVTGLPRILVQTGKFRIVPLGHPIASIGQYCPKSPEFVPISLPFRPKSKFYAICVNPNLLTYKVSVEVRLEL